ncbi:DMT family transporter [Kiloniella laminariae]|uniref:DMT family transporter n=1 Tax=Kiloniella laminariae TaxID=454162 RepID=UPI000373BDFF|nr:EamA family transporter [Kiloniella laminariae]
MTQNQDHPVSLRDYSILGIVFLLWGLNYIAIKVGVSEFPVWTALAIRFSIIFLLLAPFVRYPKGQFRSLLTISLVLIPGHFGLLFWSIQHTASVGAISVIIQLGPAFSVLLAWIFFRDIPGIKRISGLTLGFIGVVILFYEPTFFDSMDALLAGLASAFCMGFYTILIRGKTLISPLAIICWSSALGIPFSLALAFLLEPNIMVSMEAASLNGWLGVTYAAIASSIIGHGSWAWMLRRHPISFLAPLTLSVPVIAVFATVMVFDEPFTLHMAFAGLIVLAGMGLITVSKAYK